MNTSGNYSKQHVIESNIWSSSKSERFGTSPNHVVSRDTAVAPASATLAGKWGILDPHESISAATEWSEREHLHQMVNKLTLDNLELKTNSSNVDKLNLQLENRVKDLEEDLDDTKKQLNKSLIAEKELCTSELVRSDWLTGCTSMTSVTSDVTQTSNHTNNMKTPGIIIQLSTNPWQEDQESHALRELVNIFIQSMTPPVADDVKNRDTIGLGFAMDTIKTKDSFDYQTTSCEDQYLLPVELTDIERLTAVMNTRQIVARCDFDRELVSMDGDYEGDPARFFLNIHRMPNGNISEGDIENIIATLKFERKKNDGLLNAVKELEKQQYELTHAKRAALIHLERERTQNKRLTTVISTLKQHKRLPIAPPMNKSANNASNNNLWSSRWFLLCFGAVVQMLFAHFISFVI